MFHRITKKQIEFGLRGVAWFYLGVFPFIVYGMFHFGFFTEGGIGFGMWMFLLANLRGD